MPGPEFFKQLGFLVVPNFLAPGSEVELCCQMAAAPTAKATVTSQYGEERFLEDVRRVDCSILAQEISSPLRQRLQELIPEVEKHFAVEIASCEAPQYLIYRPGDFFKAHTDRGPAEPVRQRLVSAVIFLNREAPEPEDGTYGGGQLTFYGLMKEPGWEKCAFPLRAEPGLLIAFPADVLHEVKPVSHGQRLTAVSWFTGREPAMARTEAQAAG